MAATRDELINIIYGLSDISNEFDSTLSDKFADIEIALDNIGLKDKPIVRRAFTTLSNRQYQLQSDIKALQKIIKEIVSRVPQPPFAPKPNL